jgi:hypothetical protein
MYVKSIRAGGQDILGLPLDISNPSSLPFNIVLANDPASFKATVTSGGRTLSGAVVVLIPVMKNGRREGTVGFTDGDGVAAIRDLAPGEYDAYAWKSAPNGSWDDPEVLRPLAGKAVRVKLGPRESQTKKLIALPALE